MMQEKAHYKRYCCTGPGGRNCTCCYPAPGKFRKLLDKTFKRHEKQESKKEILRELYAEHPTAK